MKAEIKDLIIAQQNLARQTLSEYSVFAENIIVSKTTDQNRIEHTLDGMLDFCFDADMLLLFKKLCRYYFTINPQATAFYIKSYRQMWDSESIDNLDDVV
ncbi:MAG: hypothetical protein NTX61_07385 [Bacteroidetes bacterium]|nr:hypothetical protein [Bacteroidota bacterium]